MQVNTWLVLSCILVLLMLFSIAASMRRSVYSMLAAPEAHEAPDAAKPLMACVSFDLQAMLDAEGFRFTRAYAFNSTTFGIWIRISAQPPLRIFSVMKAADGVVAHEFFTSFSDDATLTTTTTRAAFLFPLPFGTFTQCFPHATPETLWKAHQTEDHLISVVGIPVKESRIPILETFKLITIRKLSYVTSLRLWYVRGVYWYLIRRFLLHNRPIWRQEIGALYGKNRT